MSGLFSPDNPVVSALERLFDLAWLSILWLIFSLPVITAGASTTALYYTATKVIRQRRGHVSQEFWRGFKTNIKQSTIVWAIYLLVMYVLGTDVRIAALLFDNRVMQYVLEALMVAITAVLFYALAYTARFVQGVRRILINSTLLAVRHLLTTLSLLAIAATVLYIVYLMLGVLIVAPAVVASIFSIMLESIFVRYMREDDREKEESRDGT